MSFSPKKVRAAVIGFGRNGASMHGEPLRDLPAFDLVAVADIDANRRDWAESNFGAAFYTDHRKMLNTTLRESDATNRVVELGQTSVQ